MDKHAKDIEHRTNILVQNVALEAHQLVDRYTPVDTGKARSNWVVRIGAPFAFIYNPYAPIPSRYKPPYGPGGSRAERANLSAAIAQGKGVVGVRRPGQDIYITNNLPYIQRLNEGYSDQSPAGFVHSAVTVAARLVRAKKLLGE